MNAPGVSQQTRIVLFGPDEPLFKGGIAHYTQSLANALHSAGADLTLLTFRRAYPSFLYKGQAGAADAAPTNSLYTRLPLIDWANPLSWRAAANAIRELRPDLLIVQWWTFFWAPETLALLMAAAPTLCIIHNLTDHERNSLTGALGMRIIGRADAFIAHNSEISSTLRRRFPKRLVVRQFHPTYAMFAGDAPPVPRTTILAPPTLLFFGHVRPYKGLDLLLDALRMAIVHIPTLRLIIAGEFWGDALQVTQAQIDALDLAEQVDLRDGYLPTEAVADLFAGADALVLPYRSATGTGASKVALALRTPIIATPVGDLPDLFAMGNLGALAEEVSAASIADAILRFYSQPAGASANALAAVAESLTWDAFAQRVLELAAQMRPAGEPR